MKELRIPKKNGFYRTVVVPSKTHKERLRRLIPGLSAVAIGLDIARVQHGFVPARSPVTNALVHRGYQYSVCFDLKDCFDHVREPHFFKNLSLNSPHLSPSFYRGRSSYDGCFHRGVARQGLPTSPVIANIALAPMDAEIVSLIADKGVYTRYADDLTISTNDHQMVGALLETVPQIAVRFHHEVNPKKTKVQYAKHGRRIITGVAVDDEIHPTRAMKRRLRAALHQGNKKQAAGLSEWCKLKTPDQLRKQLKLLEGNVLEKLLAHAMSFTIKKI